MPVVAILSDTYTEYQKSIIDPIVSRLNALGYGAVIVAGRELRPDVRSHQPSYDQGNRIFSVAKGYDVAGYILLTGCLGHNFDDNELDAFVKGFTHLPTVSLGREVPCASSVCAENYSGMRRLMDHLTAEPSRRHFVFIRGFKADRDSIEREEVFREVLRDKGIRVHEHYMLTGNYVSIDAYTQMDEFLSTYRPVDAVVAANDDMAVAAIRALKKHKYKVPSDVVVAGFDDRSAARNSSPPLTSVLQPLMELSDASVGTLMSLINSSRSRDEVLPTQYCDGSLVIRASTQAGRLHDPDSDLPYQGSLADAIDVFVGRFISDHASVIKNNNHGGYEALFHMIRYLLKNRSTSFDDFFSDLEKEMVFGQKDMAWWRELDNIFSEFVVRMSRAYCFAPLITPLLELQKRIQDFNWAMKNNQQFDFQHGSLLQARLHTLISICDDIDSVWQVLATYFRHFGVKRAFLVLYKSIGGSVDCIASSCFRYTYASDPTPAFLEADYVDFESRSILPPRYASELNKGALVLNPLYFEDTQYGYLLVDPDGVGYLNFEYLSYSISTALRQCTRMQSLQIRDQAPSDQAPSQDD